MGDVFDALSRSMGKPVKPRPADDEVEGVLEDGPPRPAERPGALPLDEVKRLADAQMRNPGHAVDPLSAPPKPQPVSPPRDAARVVTNGANGTNGHAPAAASRVVVAPKGAVEKANGLPARAPTPPSAAELARQNVILEQYRQVRDGILARQNERGAKVHMLTSASGQDGRTQLLVALAQSFGELVGHRVVLVEADLRAPTFHRHFQRAFTPGLVHFLRNRASLDQSIHRTRHDHLDVLPAGDVEFTEATELVASQRMMDAIKELRERYDTVFIDAPPAPNFDDAATLGALSDECLLVARMNKTPNDLVDAAKAKLRTAGCRLAGVILSHG